MSVRRTFRLVAVVLFWLGFAASTPAQKPPTIAAAANLNFALTEIAEQFGHDRGLRVELVFGASGTLTRQIQDGAPFELFLAADEEFPNQLTAAGLTRDAGVVYAVGRLVIFAPKGSPLTVDERLEGLARLAKAGGVTRFAIANPEVAPYGKAAEAVLRKRGVWDTIRPHLVLGRHHRASGTVRDHRQRGWWSDRVLARPGTRVCGPRHARCHPRCRHPPLRQRMVLLNRASPTTTQFYELSPRRGRARDLPEARVRSATIAPHGLVGPSCLLWLGTGTIAILLPLGVWFGRLLAVHQFRGKLLVEALVTVPLVLPPTVLGFYLLVTFGARSPLGQAFQAVIGQSLPFSFEGLLLASAIANIPFVVQPIQRGFEAIPNDVRDAAACCGLTPVAAFRTHRATAGLAQRADGCHPGIRPHARRVWRRADGRRQPARRDPHAECRDLRSDAGVRRSQRRHHGGDVTRHRGRRR